MAKNTRSRQEREQMDRRKKSRVAVVVRFNNVTIRDQSSCLLNLCICTGLNSYVICSHTDTSCRHSWARYIDLQQDEVSV